MPFTATGIEGLIVVEPRVFADDRGYFYESYNAEKFKAGGITADFIQDNQAFSHYGTVRGLHYQAPPFAQAKLVRVVQGKVLDVAVDLRPASATYLRVFSIVLSAENHKQLFVPRGFAHGYSVLSESAIFCYKVDNVYSKASEGGIFLDDTQLNIDWQVPEADRIISEKDLHLPALGQHVPAH
ncbi:MAG: dTDP-4-dehydrorhamnose 3,5-epimerase [Bacteroidota bacterium]